ncbi:MAG: DUF4433 domain-containing protein [Candidatus Cloacimonadaceae bacterium]
MKWRNELYYITPIENIPSIMEHGILSYEAVASLGHSSVANSDVQKRRSHKCIPNGLPLHQYVNLYFDARNPMMYSRKDKVNNLCVLVIKQDILKVEGVVISDRNSASKYAAFRPYSNGLNNLDFATIYMEDWRDSEKFKYYYKKSVKCAEVLVPHRVNPDYISKAIVGNEIAKKMLVSNGFLLTIIIDPKMFFAE